MGKKELGAYIESKKVLSEDTAQVDWEQRKKAWIEALDRLYQNVESWLDDFQQSGGLSFEYGDKFLIEEHIGRYHCKTMKIKIAADEVLLNPIGTIIIGSRGRVDLEGKNGTAKLVFVPEDASGPKIKVSVSVDHQGYGKERGKTVSEKYVWKIATPPPTIHYFDLNADSFSDALVEIIGGQCAMLSNQHQSLDEIFACFNTSDASLRYYRVGILNAYVENADYADFTKSEVYELFRDYLEELEKVTVLNIVSSLEARFHIDYLIRATKKYKDGLSRKFRELYQRKGAAFWKQSIKNV